MRIRNLALIGICGVAGAVGINLFHHYGSPLSAITKHVVTPISEAPPEARALRLKYPYSVIPGGVFSAAELRSMRDRDEVVHEHYLGFDIPSIHLVSLTADRYQYVSFRLHDRIFWTKKRLLVPKGEVLITDGTNYARTRCGNRLSNVPMSPTTPIQPPARLLSFPDLPSKMPQLELASAPPVATVPAPVAEAHTAPGVTATVTTPAVWPAVGPAAVVSSASPGPGVQKQPNNSVPPPVTAVTPVPEPATFSLLMVVGLGAAPWLLGARRRQKRGDESR